MTVSTWTAASAIMTTGLTATDAVLIVLVAAIVCIFPSYFLKPLTPLCLIQECKHSEESCLLTQHHADLHRDYT